MSATAKIGKETIRLVNGIVNIAVLIAVLSLLAFGCYAIWDSRQVYGAADAARYETYKPAVNGGLSFRELQAINPEVIAWLTVYGTHIDYPVTQGQDNLKYVKTDAKGKYSVSGAIFLDYRSSPDFSDFNSFLYGHHMDKQTMFGEIGLFSDKGYFDIRQYGMLYYGGQEHGLEFFAFAHADAYDESVFRTNITEPDDRQAYLDMLARIAIHTREGARISADDRIVLLATCSASSTNGRDILIGKITDSVCDDPFKTGETGKPDNTTLIDEISGMRTHISLRAGILIAALPIILISLMIVLIHKKRKRARMKK